jgi:hypothetical protein
MIRYIKKHRENKYHYHHASRDISTITNYKKKLFFDEAFKLTFLTPNLDQKMESTR